MNTSKNKEKLIKKFDTMSNNILKKKKEFIEKVDSMLGILYDNDNNKISRLINSVCNKLVNSDHKIKNNGTRETYETFQKILPCNDTAESLITTNIYLENKKPIQGAESAIYSSIIKNKIFKKSNVDDSYESLFGMIVDYLLYETVIEPNYSNKTNNFVYKNSDYLCKTYEIGQYTNNTGSTFFYEIMDDCGISIADFIKSIKINDKNNSQKNTLFNNLLIIFYKMIYGVKILHDLGYAHLDIKPGNFLISFKNDKNEKLEEIIFTEVIDNNDNHVYVKIIDFGTIRKIGAEITVPKEGIGTPEYTHQNLLPSTTEKKITITPIYDILSLRKSFIYIIGVIFLKPDEYKSNKTNNVEKFNETISKILDKLKGKKELQELQELLIILDNIIANYNIYTNINILLNAFSRLSNINTTNRKEITIGDYTIYYYENGRSLPYIILTANPAKKYPITKEIIKKLVNTKAIVPVNILTPEEIKQLFIRKYKNFATLSKISGKEITVLNPNNKTFDNYANNFSKKTNLKNLKELFGNTNYIKYNNTNSKYKKTGILSILEKLTVDDIKSIISGNISNNNTSNKVSVHHGLENILSILVNILYYKQDPSSKLNEETFYVKTYEKYRRNQDKFILEIIYELICEKFENDTDINPLIYNLKQINFLPYGFRNKQKKNNKKNKTLISELKENEDLFRVCKDLKADENYFYSPDNTSILYFGKLEKINRNKFMQRISYDFKYYAGANNICETITLNIEELKDITFYEFNDIKKNINKNTKPKNGMFNKVKGLFSSSIGSSKSSSSSSKTSSGTKTSSNKKPSLSVDELIAKALSLLNTNNSIITNPYADNTEKDIGLKNYGAMCYALSALQFLYHNESIREGVLNMNISPINTTKTNVKNVDNNIEILKCIKYIFYLFQTSNEKSINLCTNGILALLHSLTIKKSSKNRSYNQQEDSQEFLNKILDSFKDLKLDIIVNSFKIDTLSTLKSNGNPNRSKEETENFLQLEIIKHTNTSKDINIENLINKYFDVEILKNAEIFTANNGTRYNKKQLSITNSSKYVFISLKRFSYKNGKQSKIGDAIEINYNITLKDKKYKLTGIICHLGDTPQSGHYIYYKFTDENNVILFNDSSVKNKKYNDVKNNIETQCYVLMYEEVKP